MYGAEFNFQNIKELNFFSGRIATFFLYSILKAQNIATKITPQYVKHLINRF